MSVTVDLEELDEQLRRHGFGYLLTVGDELRAHAVAVRPVLDGGMLTMTGLGRRTTANATLRPDVSLVFPPVEPGGYSLIVDGEATVTDDGVRVRPSHAVLHRPADHAGPGDPTGSGADEAAGATGCGNDCVPLGS